MMITNPPAVNTVTHKPIPQSFDKKGFHYEQVRRQGDAAIYAQTRAGSELHNYEVIKIGRHNGYIMGGVYIAPAETYPGSSLWGLCAWTCTTVEDANRRFDALAT